MLPGLLISADDRTNSIIVNGPQDRLEVVEALLVKLDSPEKAGALGAAGGALPKPETDRRAVPQVPRPAETNLPVQVAGTGIHLDLVSLGTASVEARAALRQAQARHDRLKKLAAGGASQEELDAAKLGLEAAKEKVEMLTELARSAIGSVRAEYEVALAHAKRVEELRNKGLASQADIYPANAQIEAAKSKLRMLESILGSGMAPAAPAKP